MFVYLCFCDWVCDVLRFILAPAEKLDLIDSFLFLFVGVYPIFFFSLKLFRVCLLLSDLFCFAHGVDI